MTLGEAGLLMAAILVLLSSVFAVAARRRSELATERETAALLQRVAETLSQVDTRQEGARAADVPATLAVRGDYGVSNVRISVRLPPVRSAAERHDVLDFWEHLTGDPDDASSYRALLGPAFDDALHHAAKVGVVPRDQAEALISWADTTSAIARARHIKAASVARTNPAILA